MKKNEDVKQENIANKLHGVLLQRLERKSVVSYKDNLLSTNWHAVFVHILLVWMILNIDFGAHKIAVLLGLSLSITFNIMVSLIQIIKYNYKKESNMLLICLNAPLIVALIYFMV